MSYIFKSKLNSIEYSIDFDPPEYSYSLMYFVVEHIISISVLGGGVFDGLQSIHPTFISETGEIKWDKIMYIKEYCRDNGSLPSDLKEYVERLGRVQILK